MLLLALYAGMAHNDNSAALSQDPNYKQTVANTLRILRQIRQDVERGETFNAISRLDFAIECFEGHEHI